MGVMLLRKRQDEDGLDDMMTCMERLADPATMEWNSVLQMLPMHTLVAGDVTRIDVNINPIVNNSLPWVGPSLSTCPPKNN